LGEVVGYSDVIVDNIDIYHGFLYSNSHLRDLNDMIRPNSDWIIQQAVGVNDRGRIAATAIMNCPNQQSRAVLLTLDCRDPGNKNCDSCRR
jgi:probable HAF family extracellular repeat protein